jgi:hypothetical protein
MTFDQNAAPSTSTQVVLGSMSRADEYQNLVTSLKAQGGVVQGEMVDRVLDGGEWLCDRGEDLAATD